VDDGIPGSWHRLLWHQVDIRDRGSWGVDSVGITEDILVADRIMAVFNRVAGYQIDRAIALQSCRVR